MITAAKRDFAKLLFYKKRFHQILLIFKYLHTYFCGWVCCLAASLHGSIHKEGGGIQVLACLAPSNQTVRAIVSKAGQKNQQKLSSDFNGKILTLESSSISWATDTKLPYQLSSKLTFNKPKFNLILICLYFVLKINQYWTGFESVNFI